MHKRLRTAIILVFFVCYLSVLLYVVFFARRRGALKGSGIGELLNLQPVINQFRTFRNIHPGQTKELFNFYSNLVGNILLFSPLPFFLASLVQLKTFTKIILISLLASLSIELVQFCFRIGVADIDDVLLNVSGAAFGCLLLHGYFRFSNTSINRTAAHL